MTISAEPDNGQTAEQPPVNNGDQIQVNKIQNSMAVAIGHGATAVYQGLTIQQVVALVVELKQMDQPKVWDGRVPYLGLKSFREEDAKFFFGREKLVDDLLQRLEEENKFIVISGPSGSGKSSAARAGLFHALREGRVEGSKKWVLVTMSPKEKPIENLALALSRDGGARVSEKVLLYEGLTNPLALHEQVERLKAMSDDPLRRFVLLVDQFEELFTQTKDEGNQAAFIDLLTTAAGVEGGRSIIVLCLRSDFVSNCALYPELRELINKKNQFHLVGAMESRDLAKAITLPALEVGAEIEPALVKVIIDDMKGEPGTLPLMSFALRDLFLAEKTTKGEAMDMTLQEYLDRGGIDQALERHADKVFASFTNEQKELAKGIFSKLVTVGEGRLDTRRTARFKELKPANADASAVVAVVGKLSAEDVRLVTTSGVEDSQELTVEEMSTAQATVTISHEKLIDAWPWLRRLIDENRELIVLQNQIQTDAWKWGEEKDNGYLYRGGRLSNVEENLRELKPNLDQMSKRFIDASIRQRQLIRWGTITVVALLLIIFAGAAFAFSQQAARAQMQGERALAQSLQANSRALVANQPNNQELAKARLLAVEGLEVNEQVGSLDDKTGSVSLLFSLGYEQPIAYQPVTILRNHSNEVTNVAWNGDGSRLASASYAEVIIWDTANWEPVTTLSGHWDWVYSVAWNEDGSRLASASRNSTVIIWDTASWQPVTTLSEHTYSVSSVAWNEDGSRLASASLDSTIIIWDTANWEPVTTPSGHWDWVNSVAWNEDGSRLASASRDSTVIIWDTANWEPVTLLSGHTNQVTNVAWNGDGNRLATASDDDSVIIWDTASWERVMTLNEHTESVNSVAWNGDGSRLATASDDDRVIIWDTASWQPVTNLNEHTYPVLSVAWNWDGSRLASASTGNTVIIWDTANWEPVTLLSGHTNQVTNVAWNGDSSRLASASWDTTIIIWKFPDFAQLHCQLAGRNLSLTEWEKFLPDVDYHCTCEEWPAGDGAPTDAQGCAEQ